MGARAVARFGKAGGAGAVGSEGDDMAGETPKAKTEEEIRAEAAAAAAAREATVIEGGPGAGETRETPSFKVTYKGKEFNSEAELTAYLDNLGTEIETLKAKPPAAPAAEPAKPAAPTNTKKRLEDLGDDELIPLVISNPKQLITQLKGELREEYQTAENNRKAMDQFWVDFWNDNKELKPHENIVKMVMDGNMRKLAPMSMGDAAAELAKLSRNTILTINKDAFQKKKPDPANRAVVEGAGTSSAPAPRNEEQPDQRKGSLTAMIKKRQAARAAAANGSQRAKVS